jgi:1-acyl-sn-glycerol-3-phosphate acyltransferase
MRAKTHHLVETKNKKLEDKKEIRDQVRTTIYHQLLQFNIQKKK